MLICDRANLLMVDGKKQKHNAKDTHMDTHCTQELINVFEGGHTHLCSQGTWPTRATRHTPGNVCTESGVCSALHCSWCWAPSLLLLPVHLARSAAEECHNYPAGDAHAHTSTHTLVLCDPRRSLLLLVTTGASLDSVCVCVC